ncbi:KTSC domain-containing protein [Aquipseudomonas alcaligenes]|uniref:KTSC domain-containing protein n=1 Tax=Aquipseudomonas alcaligenes TaxID=43263 RepID=A0A2V4LGS8_AQUAC|nr:KTSC domain-containing protein [Pseudomonas alcaligenes]PYC20257.1 KTSC domain-containing protein [Pseudomonas alcaligenes]
MKMTRVSSSAISAIGYDPATKRMKITFQQGHTYDFCGVPQHVYDNFMRAPSKGHYYNDYIKDRYQC